MYWIAKEEKVLLWRYRAATNTQTFAMMDGHLNEEFLFGKLLWLRAAMLLLSANLFEERYFTHFTSTEKSRSIISRRAYGATIVGAYLVHLAHADDSAKDEQQ